MIILIMSLIKGVNIGMEFYVFK